MTPPPKNPGRGPTVELRDYIERILDEREKAQAATFAAAMREADANSREMERRLDGLNELRSEVTRDRARFLERKECELKQGGLCVRVENIERWNSKLIGVGLVLAVLAGVFSAALTLLIR